VIKWLKKKRPQSVPTPAVPQVEPTAPPVGAGVEVLVARWDGALAEIAQRFDAVLADASAACESQIGDIAALGRIWSAVEHSMHQHTGEVSDRWDEISDEMSELDDFPEDLLDSEGDKRDLATCELEIQFYRVQRAVMARAAVGQPPAVGALLLAQQAAQEHWEAMKRAETRIQSYRERRDVPMPLLEQYDAASRQYWTTLVQVEAEHDPAQQPHVARKLEARLKDANKLLMQHWQWRERSA
jgi:hypothetical protein